MPKNDEARCVEGYFQHKKRKLLNRDERRARTRSREQGKVNVVDETMR